MNEKEFKTQIFKKPPQWGSGLFYRLEELKDGGCTILSIPAVSKKLEGVDSIVNPVVLAADCCGMLYLLDGKNHHLYRYDPATGVSERIYGPESLDRPRRMVLRGKRLWVADTKGGEILGYSLTNFQIVSSIRLLESPVDIAVNRLKDLYALDGETKLLYRFDWHGSFLGKFGKQHLQDPVSVSVGKGDVIYVVDRGTGGFLKFSKEGDSLGAGRFSGSMGTPVILIGDAEGGGFMLNDSGEVYRFDQDGISSGKVRFPEDAGPVIWIADNGYGNLYATTQSGIYPLVSQTIFTKEKGFYYSKTLDSGTTENRWHRLVLQADIPPDTAADIYSYASEDATLRDLVEAALADPAKTTEEKAVFIDSVIPWVGPETNAQDMLFKVKAGRFLWVKLGLETYDEMVRPTVREMKIYTPRISYLRYLPAIYQEDPVSKDFLERFLALFESIFFDLEVEISEVTRYFDPDTAPPEFLRWLASWVNLAIEEDWQEETKRQFIREAARLYTMKGTVAGIRRFIQIYTGKAPFIVEHARAGHPIVLGGPFRLGSNAIVVKTPVRGFRVGDDSIIGGAALRDVVYSPEDPFLTSAYRFTVLIDLTQEERDRYEKGLKAILADGKPAHTAYAFRVTSGFSAASDSYVGISTFVRGFDPFRIGSSPVGMGLLPSLDEKSGRIGDGAVIGKDTKLM